MKPSWSKKRVFCVAVVISGRSINEDGWETNCLIAIKTMKFEKAAEIKRVRHIARWIATNKGI